MAAVMETVEKGNIVKGNATNREGLVLRVRKDGTRALVHIFGEESSNDRWMPVERFTVTISKTEKCYKCAGSGLFYFGGATVNGVYTGRTGPCYGCSGTGVQNNADRLRCHYYFRDHYRVSL